MSRRLILIYVMFLTNTAFRFCTRLRHLTYWLKWRVHSAQSAALSDGVVVACLHQTIPLLWRGGRHKHFVMHAFNNHVKVLHDVAPIDLLAQSAALSDGVVVACLHNAIPLLWRGGRRSLTGWLQRFCTKSRRLCYCNKRRFYFPTFPCVNLPRI